MKTPVRVVRLGCGAGVGCELCRIGARVGVVGPGCMGHHRAIDQRNRPPLGQIVQADHAGHRAWPPSAAAGQDQRPGARWCRRPVAPWTDGCGRNARAGRPCPSPSGRDRRPRSEPPTARPCRPVSAGRRRLPYFLRIAGRSYPGQSSRRSPRTAPTPDRPGRTGRPGGGGASTTSTLSRWAGSTDPLRHCPGRQRGGRPRREPVATWPRPIWPPRIPTAAIPPPPISPRPAGTDTGCLSVPRPGQPDRAPPGAWHRSGRNSSRHTRPVPMRLPPVSHLRAPVSYQ